jgi:hypothetical protein
VDAIALGATASARYINGTCSVAAEANSKNKFCITHCVLRADNYFLLTSSLLKWLGGCAKGYFFIESVEVI